MKRKKNDYINNLTKNTVTIEIRKTKIDEDGHIYETIEEQQVPEFLAHILTGNMLLDTE